MSVKAIHNFEHAVHSANEWIKDLAEEPEIGSEGQAYTILRIVLHTLRDRLRVDEVVHLSAQLPMLIRGFYFEGWKPPQGEPREGETMAEFLEDLGEKLLRVSEIEAEDAVYLVYILLARRFSSGELQYVERAMPYELVLKWRPSLPKGH
jgi:uncharacterized protein (DUF2267 family)